MPATSDRVFTSEYEERLTTKSGRQVVLRLIRPEDKPLLLSGLARMSPESRYRRFFAHRDSLNAVELKYLTELDQEHHFALGIACEHADDTLEGVGVGRFVRVAADPTIAELAVSVVDDWHGEGLGRALLTRLIAAGHERGIVAFRLEVLAQNDNMLGVVQKIFPDAHYVQEREVLVITCPLPQVDLAPIAPDDAEEAAKAKQDSPLFQLMRLAASGTARVLQSMRGWPIPKLDIKVDKEDVP